MNLRRFRSEVPFLVKMLAISCILVGIPMIRSSADETVTDDVNYRQQIQPLLAEHCYACHGPDSETRAADLRLDDEAVAKDYAIVPGDAGASDVISRIFSDDPDVIMPPPDARRPLSNEQKELLKRWVNEGAPWQKHWAFEPIAAVSVPQSESPTLAIDRFVQNRMRPQGLSPASPADKATILRRVYLDLIGLPPTPNQLAAFESDTTPEAFERVVDGLLASPHYGEQMAVDWLDVARYADTNGYQNDFVRNMWPWRDWVIATFNRNQPYDQFIIEQLAGDMLVDPTRDQLIASGFNRNNPSVTEGGSIEEEWRIENAIDRVETTAGAFLGLTMGCARCHDHKYDPVSQKEFYEFFAFFNNVDEQGVYNEKRGNAGPQIEVPTDEQTADLSELTSKIDQLQQRADAEAAAKEKAGDGHLGKAIEDWRATLSAANSATLPQPIFVFNGRDVSGLTEGNSPTGVGFVLPGNADAAVKVEPAPFAFTNDAAFSWSVWVQGDARGAIFGQMDDSNGYRGVDGLIQQDGRLKIHLIHNWPDNALAVISRQPLSAGQWNFVTVTYDGGGKAGGVKVYFNGKSGAVEVNVDALKDSIQPTVPFQIGGRSTSEFLKGELSDFRIYDRVISETEIDALLHRSVVGRYDQLAETAGNAAGLQTVRSYLDALDTDITATQLADLRSQHQQLVAKMPTTMVMKERPGAYRETYRLQRGQYDQPDTSEPLMPSVPAALPSLGQDQPPNRLGLARWMVDSRNPLVARVAVNRAWLKFFGRGLVASVGNFGLQGDPPTHPLLLDWLAEDFRAHGWDVKRLNKMIVMSKTYQQSSDLSDDAIARDSANRWYARGPRYRMTAEQIRDSSLSASGLLIDRIGGASVYPYQPDGLWEELAGGASNGPYIASQGDDLYRRSMYTYRKRTVSHPTLATFDTPTWETCQLKRPRTNTPLQSLALLNDITYVEAARKLAERMMTEPNAKTNEAASTVDSIRHGFLLTTLRQPTDTELDVLKQGYGEYLNYYSGQPDDAAKLLATGDSVVESSLPPDRLAAMTSIASILLNLDEAITKE